MAKEKQVKIKVSTKGTQKSKKELKGVSKSVTSVGKAVVAAAAAFVTFQGAMKAVKLAELSAKARLVEMSFRLVAAQPDIMLEKMKKAVAGTIAEMELMRQFNTAALLGLPLERFDEMLAIARGAAQATGESMDFMLQSIVTALGRQSKLMLDNLGIILSAEDASREYADALGIQASKLTDAQKKQAFVNKALEIGNANLEKMGGLVDSSADSYGRFRSSAEDLGIELGKVLDPVLSSMADSLSSGAKSLASWFDIMSENDSVIKELKKEIRKLEADIKNVFHMTSFDRDLWFLAGGKGLQEMVTRLRELQRTLLAKEFQAGGGLENYAKTVQMAHDATSTFADELPEMLGDMDMVIPWTELFGDPQYWWDLSEAWGAQIKELDKYKQINQYIDQLGSNMAQAAIYGQEMGEAVVAALKAIAAQILADLAIYAIAAALNIPIMPGGSAAAGQGTWTAIKGLMGSTQGGGSTTNNNISITAPAIIGTNQQMVDDQLIPMIIKGLNRSRVI